MYICIFVMLVMYRRNLTAWVGLWGMRNFRGLEVCKYNYPYYEVVICRRD
jgi:hypothetical protein